MSSSDPQEISDRARERLEKRFGELESRIRLDGKADRAAMGNPDKTLGQVMREFAAAWNSVGAGIKKGLGL